MRPVTRKGLEKAVLKLFAEHGRPIHLADLKREFGVKTKAVSKEGKNTETALLSRNLLHLFHAGRLSKSEELAKVKGYPVSPYSKKKYGAVANVRFYAPPDCAGKTIAFRLNGTKYELRFAGSEDFEGEAGPTKREMAEEILRASERALTTNEVLEAINERYDAYEIGSKKDFYNATTSLMHSVLRRLLREDLRARKIDGRWIWYYTEEQLESFERHYVENDYILRSVNDMVKSERCVPLTRVASTLHATPAEVAYRVRRAGKVVPVKVKVATAKTETRVEVEVPSFSRDSLAKWLGVAVPKSENGYGYETMLVNLDSDWDEALEKQIKT